MTANQTTRLKTNFDSLDFLSESSTLTTLETAADLFVHYDNDKAQIWASSRDWFMEQWGRDTFISLPGLLLTTEKYDAARKVFLDFAQYERGGLIPNRIRDGIILYNTADGSLWFVHALKMYIEATQDWAFIQQLLPRLRNIILGYMRGATYERTGKEYRIGMDDRDGLIGSPAQASWMDADPAGDGSEPVTPRAGKCVEINALWYNALRFVIDVEKRLDPHVDVTELETQASRVKVSFQKFWNDKTGCLYDVIDSDETGSAIRPNQIFAISHGLDLLTSEQKEAVLAVVKRDLLTAGGLRTLSPHDPLYKGEYDTSAPVDIKDLGYHQGTVWPWLIGAYCDALRIVKGDQVDGEIGEVIAPLVNFCLESEFKSLPEVFSGNSLEPGGTTSQAWSVAEVLRISKGCSFRLRNYRQT
ncbi:MAG: amylo-alpha-1,6-glucosidase [Candidatus Saccharimonadales bacterium]